MAPEQVTLPKSGTVPRHLGTATKFALIGAVILGAIAYVHVAWDGHAFQASGLNAVDDPRLIFLSITVLGALVGGAAGAVVGLGVSLLRSRK